MSEKIVFKCRGCDKAVEFLIQEIWLLRRSRSRLLKKLGTLRKELGRPEENDE